MDNLHDKYCDNCAEEYKNCYCIEFEKHNLNLERAHLLHDWDKVLPENRARYEEIIKRLIELERADAEDD